MKTQTNLLKSIDNLTGQVADLTTQNKTLQQKVNDLLSQISVGNKVRFGSTSQKDSRKKAVPIKDREKDKDDFDGTNGAAMSSATQTDTASADAGPEPAEQTQKSYENSKGQKYQTMNADNHIVHESDINLLLEGSTVYMYIDKELVDVDHLCCLAHVRAKFQYALEQGKDKEAEYFLRLIGILYDLEEQYRLRHLTPEKIQLSSFYHTFIETCKMCGVSTLEYFKEFFTAIMQGRTDYENMLPMTIGIKK